MIYFVAVNNLHYIWSSLMAGQIREVNPKEEISMIKFLPSALTKTNDDHLYRKIYVSQTFFGKYTDLLNLAKLNRLKRDIKAINFKKDDIIFMFTEYEIGNHYIAKVAKKNKAKVFLVDEGIGTYLTHNLPRLTAGSSIKQRIIGHTLRYLNGFYSSSRLTGSPNYYFPRLDDRFFDGYILFYNMPIERKIPKIYLKQPYSKAPDSRLRDDSALILGQALNEFRMTEKEYIDSVLDIAASVRKNFKHVYFKYHPSEVAFYLKHPEFVRLGNELKRLKVEIVPFEKAISAEELIFELEYPPKFIVSQISTALLNSFLLGCQPVFTFHLLGKDYIEFSVLKNLLNNLNYKFIAGYKEIVPEYNCNLDISTLSNPEKELKDFYKSNLYIKNARN